MGILCTGVRYRGLCVAAVLWTGLLSTIFTRMHNDFFPFNLVPKYVRLS